MYKLKFENCVISNGVWCKCYLCHNKFPFYGKFEKHINCVKHKTNLEEVESHSSILISNISSSLSKNKVKEVVRNFITFNHDKSNSFTCHCCGISVSELKSVFEHINTAEHQLLVKDDVLEKVTYERDTIFVQRYNKKLNMSENFITYINETKLFSCSTCSFCCNKKEKIFEHVNSEAHSMAIKAKKNVEHLSKKNIVDQKFFQSECNIVNEDYCKSCQVFFKNNRELQCHVMIHVYKSLMIDPCTDILKISKLNEKMNLECRLCNLFLKDYCDLSEHLVSNTHSERMNFFRVIKDNIEVENIKNIQVRDIIFKELEFEINENIFKANQCWQKEISNLHCLDSENVVTSESKISSADNFYLCFFCSLHFSNLSELLVHYNSLQHKRKIQCFNLIYNCPHFTFEKLNKNIIIRCYLCMSPAHKCRIAIEHLYGKKHCSHLKFESFPSNSKSNLNNETNVSANGKRFTAINSNSIENFEISNLNNKPEISSSIPTKINRIIQVPLFEKSKDAKICMTNSQTLVKLDFDLAETNRIDDALNDLVSMQPNHKQKRQLPVYARDKRHQASESNKKNSFNKNALLYGCSYIQYCIDSGKKNIYNADQRIAQYIKLGVDLTFVLPHHSKRICLPCGVYFSNKNQILFEHLHCKEHVNNLIELEDYHKEFEHSTDQFSDLKLAKLYMQEESDDWIYCYACDIKIKNDNSQIILHSENLNHISKSECWKKQSDIINQEFSSMINNNWYYAENFICGVCKVKIKYEIEFIIHLQKLHHIKKVNKLKNDGVELKFGCCYTCTSYWYGNADFYENHIEDNFHKLILDKKTFTVPKMRIVALDYISEINAKMDALLNASDKVQLEKVKETNLIKDIETTVESKFPDAKTYIFGSRISYLGFPDSDVDVFLDCENTYHLNITQEKSKKYLLIVEQLIESKKELWSIDETLVTTRVPILKLKHIPTGLKCDISIMNGLGVEKSSLIGYYNNSYPTCRKMILYLKKWLNLCQLSGPDCLTTFAISWFVIFYLQREGILPTVYDLIKRKNESKIIAGWECGIESQFTVESSKSCLKLLYGFFKFYADFDYKTSVLCPYLGQILGKRAFAFSDQLPEEMKLYKLSLKNFNNAEAFRIDSPMCIQDPIDLSQNITKAVKKLKLRCFIKYCADSAEKVLPQIVQ